MFLTCQFCLRPRSDRDIFFCRNLAGFLALEAQPKDKARQVFFHIFIPFDDGLQSHIFFKLSMMMMMMMMMRLKQC